MKFKDLITYNEMKFLNPVNVNLKYLQLTGEVADFSFLWFITFEILEKTDISKVEKDLKDSIKTQKISDYLNEIFWRQIEEEFFNSNEEFLGFFTLKRIKTLINNIKKLKLFYSNENIILWFIPPKANKNFYFNDRKIVAYFIQENEQFLVQINKENQISFGSNSFKKTNSFYFMSPQYLRQPKIDTSKSLTKVLKIVEFLCKKINSNYFLVRGQKEENETGKNSRDRLYKYFIPKLFGNKVKLSNLDDGHLKVEFI